MFHNEQTSNAKMKSFLCLINRHNTKAYSRVEAEHHILTLALSKWSASRIHCLTPADTAPARTHREGCWVGTTASPEASETKKKFLRVIKTQIFSETSQHGTAQCPFHTRS